jgi:glycolate oxidase FAD binding subunit
METRAAALKALVERVRDASARGAPLEIRGGGTKRFYGEPASGEPLATGALRGVTSYEPTELVVTACAGTPLSELETLLRGEGQCLAFEPPRFGAESTVGGMVAAGLSGPARVSAGAVRDHVLGALLLNGRGELLTFGGQVAKNVAGYDVSRLLAGSLGILGVICEVSLKVLPFSRDTATLRFALGQAAALAQVRRWASQPLPIVATSWYADVLHVRLAGARAAVREALAGLGGEQLESDAAARWWDGVRDQRHPFFDVSASALAAGDTLWRFSLPATAAPLSLPGEQFIEWHGAQRWWRGSAAATAVRAAAAQAGGSASIMRAAQSTTGVFHPLRPAELRIHAALKASFDPQRIFNPGRLYAGL